MVLANEGGHADRATEIRSIASKIGCSRESLRRWVVQAEGADQNRHLSSRFAAGGRPGDRIGALDVLSALRFRSAIAPSVDEALRRPVKTARYLALRYTERLANAGSATSVGSVGDSDDNALAETIIGLCKAEMIHRRTPSNGRPSDGSIG